ncbi:MAG TPA: hypothetical protein VLL76_06900, partial [Candidatus Omnitrophota bacterium]|nr:hypothetical protein [Candidatus Omnitrophota bacterium]
MKRATTVVLALGALVGVGMQPALAQVVIGGDDVPDVQVNMSVLDRLGPTPNLADMLKADVPGARTNFAPAGKGPQGVQFRPYKPEKVIKKVAAERART